MLLFLVVASLLNCCALAISATKTDAFEVLAIATELTGIPGNSFTDAEGSLYCGFWYPGNDAPPYVVKVTSTLGIAWKQEIRLEDVSDAQPFSAPVLTMSDERQPYVILPLAPYKNSSRPESSQEVQYGALAVFAIDQNATALSQPSLVIELVAPFVKNLAPRCIYSAEFADDILYCSAEVQTGSSSAGLLWNIRMSVDRGASVIWDRYVTTTGDITLFKSMAMAEDTEGESLIVAFAGNFTGLILGEEDFATGERVIGVQSWSRQGTRIRHSYMKANDANSYASSMAVGSSGAIFLAEAPSLLHRVSFRNVEGLNYTLTRVWSAPNVKDNIVSLALQGSERILVAGSTTRLQAGLEGSGAPMSVESPVVAVYTMSGAERYREVFTVHALDVTMRISTLSLANATTGDVGVVGHSFGGVRSGNDVFFGTFRARTEQEIASSSTANITTLDEPGVTPLPDDDFSNNVDGSGERMEDTKSSNSSMAVGFGVGIGFVAVLIVSLLALFVYKQHNSTQAAPREELELNAVPVPAAGNALA